MRRFLAVQGIAVFVGPNGSGKSLLAVDSLLETLDGDTWVCRDPDHVHNRPFLRHANGCEVCEPVDFPDAGRCEEGTRLLDVYGQGVRLVYSTLPFLGDDGRPHDRYRPLIDYRQLVEVEHADVLFDEVAGVSDASDSASTPAALVRWLQQLRKRDVRLRVTTPAYDRCSKPIRQVATAVIDCRAYFPERPKPGGRRWRPNRAMLLLAYDGFEFATFEKNSGKRQVPLARLYFWRPGCRAERSYSTLGQVHALAEVSDAGMCTACGGSRSRPRCACGDQVDAIPYGELRVIEKVSPAGARVRHAVPMGSD
jgi:hypothetical protein